LRTAEVGPTNWQIEITTTAGGNPLIVEDSESGFNELAAPRPTLLDEQKTWMRPYVVCSDKERLWKEVDSYPQADPPKKVAEGLEQSLPKGASNLRFATPSKGGGSLGRPRYVAIAAWRGGHIGRDAKALVPSAWDWAHAKGSSTG
jgi:hypothetical protein